MNKIKTVFLSLALIFTFIVLIECLAGMAFREWWPELKKGLHTFRITGGEPLLSSSTFKVMESLIAEPEPSLTLAVNSNLGAPAVLMDRFIAMTESLINNKAIKKLEIFTSIDAYGKRAEYIRNGLKHEYFWSNVEKLLVRNKQLQVSIMCTFNSLSISSYIDLLKKIMALNLKFRSKTNNPPVYLDIAYLRYPQHQTVKVLPDSYISEMEKIVEFISENQWQKTHDNVGFDEEQLIKSRRILEWMREGLPEGEKRNLQKNFHTFFAEHDRRRNTSFTETFPEMEEFWNTCKS